jgi:hypothetical protein
VCLLKVRTFNLLNLCIHALLGIEHRTNHHLPSRSHPSIKVESPIMTRASPQTWLETLEEQLNVDEQQPMGQPADVAPGEQRDGAAGLQGAQVRGLESCLHSHCESP